MSSDYGLVNLDKYHCRRLIRILKDENIFGFDKKPNYKESLVDDDEFQFGLSDDLNHNCSTELNMNFDLSDLIKSDETL